MIIQRAKPWMSEVDIPKGARWASEIGSSLEDHSVGIVCVTPENQAAPWLTFEAGALSKALDSSRVMPVLLGVRPRDVKGPLSQFQATLVEKEEMLKLIRSLNAIQSGASVSNNVVDETFARFWPDLEAELHGVAQMKIEGTSLNISSVTEVFGKHGMPEPSIGNHVHFSSGFESHNLYSSIFESAQRRVLVWGRKNRKVFDKEHNSFLRVLPQQMESGFDFRVLFLDPEADLETLRLSHQDDDFLDQLRHSIGSAAKTCKRMGVKLQAIARAYNGVRHTGIIVVDDAVLYSPIRFGPAGAALPLTKSSFNIIGVESKLGEELLEQFEECWSSARRWS